MSSLKMGELFAGYGGLGMGVAEVLDVDLAWVSEFDKGPSKILAHRFPGIPNHGDITKIDWSQVEPVDVLTGGSPCQDLSHAGKRAGMTEGTRSNLWVAMREAIAQLRPGLVVWENVGGAFSAAADSEVEPCAGCVGDGSGTHLRALGRVLGDLATLGYDARWVALRAADVGAPHGRLRVFVTAYPAGDEGRFNDGDLRATADGDSEGRSGLRWLHAVRRDADGRNRADGSRPTPQPPALLPSPRTSDTNGAGQHGDGGLDLRTAVSLLPTPAVNDMGASYTPEEWDAWTDRMKAEHGNGNGHGKSLHVEAARLIPTPTTRDWRDGGDTGANVEEKAYLGRAVWNRETWGQYADAIYRWESMTREAPEPTELNKLGNRRLSPRFSEWMMGLPAGWVTDIPGITRNEALKALGNGVCPQQCAAALRWLFAVEAVAA